MHTTADSFQSKWFLTQQSFDPITPNCHRAVFDVVEFLRTGLDCFHFYPLLIQWSIKKLIHFNVEYSLPPTTNAQRRRWWSFSFKLKTFEAHELGWAIDRACFLLHFTDDGNLRLFLEVFTLASERGRKLENKVPRAKKGDKFEIVSIDRKHGFTSYVITNLGHFLAYVITNLRHCLVMT